MGIIRNPLQPIVTKYQQDIPVIPLSFLKKGMGEMLLYGGIETLVGFTRNLQKTIPNLTCV